MNKLASIGLALAALLFVGCGDDLGKTCYDEDDCSGGNLICTRDVVCTGTTECIGVCSDTCVTDDDCGSEEFCLDEIGTTRRYCRFDELADRDDDMDVPMSEPDPMTEE